MIKTICADCKMLMSTRENDRDFESHSMCNDCVRIRYGDKLADKLLSRQT